MPTPYGDRTVADLRKIAADRKVDVPGKARKADLVAALEAADASETAAPPSEGREDGTDRYVVLRELQAPPEAPDVGQVSPRLAPPPRLSPALAERARIAREQQTRNPRRRPRFPIPLLDPELERIAAETRTVDDTSTGPATQPPPR